MFIDPEAYAFATKLKDHWRDIQNEALALPDDLVQPWVQESMYGTGWGIAVLNVLGRPVPEASKTCPVTTALLGEIPNLGMATFSRLAPGSRIEPHVGWGNRVYRFHLALLVPEDCGIQVGGQTRNWVEGQLLGFDDTVEHRAWNDSDTDRWVLMFDVRRPGIEGPCYDMDRVPAEVQQLANSL